MKKSQIILMVGAICFFTLFIQAKISERSISNTGCAGEYNIHISYEFFEEREGECVYCFETGNFEPVYDIFGKFIGYLYDAVPILVSVITAECQMTEDSTEYCELFEFTQSGSEDCEPIFRPA